MNLVERAKRICLTPKSEWPVIAEEPTSTGGLLTGYVLPLAAIGAVAGFVGGSIIGMPFIGRTPALWGVLAAVFTLCMAVVGVLVFSVIINLLAPTFGAQKNGIQALKVAAYSFTPAWLAAVLNLLPLLGILAILGGLYGLYLLYLGLPHLMKCPPDKAIGYTVVSVICAIVLSVVATAILGTVGGAALIGSGALSSMVGGGSSGPQFDSDSSLGRLEALSRELEESGEKMEAAQRSGDPEAQISAAMEGLGALFGGGKRFDPIAIDQLKSFVPETFAGLTRTASSAETNGLGGLMVSKAEARYGEGPKRITLEVIDTGGVSGLMGLASWANVQGESEDEYGSERTHKVDGRMVHEKMSKRGGTNEFSIVLGERFMVNTRGDGVELSELKSAVSDLDLAGLESMRNAGLKE